MGSVSPEVLAAQQDFAGGTVTVALDLTALSFTLSPDVLQLLLLVSTAGLPSSARLTYPNESRA